MSVTTREITDAIGARGLLNCGRTKLWRLCCNDPDFPRPRVIAGKNSWFVDEIEAYKESRPQRQYTAAETDSASV